MSLEYQPGRYAAMITGWGIGKANTGNSQFFLTFRVTGRIDTSRPGREVLDCPNKERTFFRAITDKTIDYLIEDLTWLGGYHHDSFEQLTLPPEHPDAPQWRDKEIEVLCEHDSYQGVARERWGLGRGGAGYQPKPAEKSDIRRLDALFRKKLRPLAGGPKEPSPAGASGGDGEVEDVPF